MKLKTLGASIGLSLALGAAAQAALISAVNVASSNFASSGGYSIAQLSAHATAASDVLAVSTYGTEGWLSAANTVSGVTITSDFGSVQAVDTVHIWNWNRTFDSLESTRGINSFDIAVSLDNVNFTNVGSFNAAQEVGGSSTVTAQSFDFGDQNARYVRLTINSNHGGSFAGISELHYENVTAVPEPSSAALLGLGGLSLIMRRRK